LSEADQPFALRPALRSPPSPSLSAQPFAIPPAHRTPPSPSRSAQNLPAPPTPQYNDGSDEEEYDFQYSDEDANEEAGDADAENQYYNAKALREDDAGKARDAFEKVLEQEQKAERSVWGFKCLKQLIKLHRKSSDDKSMLECYGRLLGYISGGAVTQNEAEKGINGILDRLDPKAGMHEVYSRTLAAFAAGGAAPNPRLWFKCSLKLGQLLLDLNDVPRFAQTVEALLAAAEEADREGNGGTTLMEIYCLQIQM
jgi:COP9 signalosome complex subunit 2